MKKIALMCLLAISLSAIAQRTNPFFSEFPNKYGIPPFEDIRAEDYLPAFREGIRQQQAEFNAIATNKGPISFENTIEALELSGELLNSVSAVFFNLYSAETNETMGLIANQISPLLTEHSDNLYLNENIFNRVRILYKVRHELGLTKEQNRVLEKYYKNFIRSGAALSEDNKAKLREINKELSMAQLTFGQNLLAENNANFRVVTDKSELVGLPAGVIQAAAEAARAAGKPGQWIFTNSRNSFTPVLQYSENRQLRKDVLLNWSNRGDNNNKHDNKEVVARILTLRLQRANLLGFETSADFILDNTMAKTSERVYAFLKSVWEPSLAKAKEERAELQKLMDAEGRGEKLEPWDWWFYAEKLRKERYDLDEELVRPYFKMENVRQGSFDLANKLWGLQFEQLKDHPRYHPDMDAFKVTDADGSYIGILITDYFPRPGKRSGAWMSSFLEQHYRDGKNIRPVIVNIGNFSKPTADKPALLSMDEVETLFHELGHGLHGLLSQTRYLSLSGTSVVRDFVELPAQIMEHWCFEPQLMRRYARHYQTGEPMPQELIDKIQRSRTFNQGFRMTEHLSAAILDMDYHTLKSTENLDVNAFEKASLENMGMIPEIFVRFRSTNFSHIFNGGYAAGYYSYSWAMVLDSDAFQAFEETGDIFNKQVADSFRRYILETGDTEDAMQLYLRFRGKEPNPKYLLKNLGLID